jgi:hypothetical protein
MFLYIAYLFIFFFSFIFIDAIHIDRLDYDSNNIEFLLIFMFTYSILGIILLWSWSRYELYIENEQITYCSLLKGKKIIKFDKIDIDNSNLLFIFPKMGLSYDVLKIKMYDGKDCTIVLDDLLLGGDTSLMRETVIHKLKIRIQEIYK